VCKNATVAREIAEESAAAGSSYGQFVLGRCIQDGKGGDNDAEASRLYRLAADQGLAIAQHNLGVMLFFGLGLEENEERGGAALVSCCAAGPQQLLPHAGLQVWKCNRATL